MSVTQALPETKASKPNLAALLHPRSFAVVGATEREGSVGRAVMENILQGGYQGRLFPVNPHRETVLGLKAYSTLDDLPESVDSALLIIPAHATIGALEACVAKGVRSAIVLSSGFRECGGDGPALENALRRTAQRAGLALLGPNCLGIINTNPIIRLNSTFAKRFPKPGNISFLSQSGALGVCALEFAAANDVGIRLFASIGNKAVLNENHLLKAFADDPGTEVILVYLEDFQAPEEFLQSAAVIGETKPVVLLKAGLGRSGSRAAASHTGALAEKTDFLDDLCAQYGILRVTTLEELFNQALCLSSQPLPKGPKLTVVTNAGGPAILAVDEAERQGLALPEPPPLLKTRLAKGLPAAAGLGNPIDLLGDAESSRYGRILSMILEAGVTDALLCICTPQMMTDVGAIAEGVAALSPRARAAGIPMLAALPTSDGADVGKALEKSGIPNFAFAETAVRSLAGAYRFRRWKECDRTAPKKWEGNKETIRSMLAQARADKRRFLTGWESQAILGCCGISAVRSTLVTSKSEFQKAVETLRFPLVAKIESPDILHKVDIGGVITGIHDVHDLELAYEALLKAAVEAKPGGAAVAGILLQEMVRDGVEVLIGAHRHPHFGCLMVFGSGGTMVEVTQDVRFRRAPINPYDADEMIRGSKVAMALEPFRGRPRKDVQALQDCLLRVAGLMESFPVISEVDLNPVFALEKGALVADARIVLDAGERIGGA